MARAICWRPPSAPTSPSPAAAGRPPGNLAYSGSSGHASHPVIATCGALSIVECDHFCDLGELGPDEVKVPGLFIDMILA